MISILLNGDKREIAPEITIDELLTQLGITCAGTAIAINNEIAQRNLYKSIIINEGDRVEVIRAIGGG